MGDNRGEILNSVLAIVETNQLNIKQELRKILIKIVKNIMENPENPMFQSLKKTNPAISKKILGVDGGSELLKCIGFVDTGETYDFDQSFMYSLPIVKSYLEIWEPTPRGDVENRFPPVRPDTSRRDPVQQFSCVRRNPLPPFVDKYQNPFLKRVAYSFHNALIYNDVELMEKARNKIPIAMLEWKAAQKMRELQRNLKQDAHDSDPSISMQDLLLVELLNWFKHDFFEWVDTPFCDFCCNTTKYSHTSTDKSYLNYTERTEMYKCVICEKYTQFHRFNDLNILLVTRKGRCGEWANVFTLMCTAMGWESRYVIDETDHVWTEVFSLVQNRWLHCDPCEAICDKPLIYENGWNKKLSYVMAYSPFEIQDVTWRYTSKHSEVLARRNLCSEDELTRVIMELRNERFEWLTPRQQNRLNSRVIVELAELMVEKNVKKDEKLGRTSGGLDWRIARGEIDQNKWPPYVFTLTDVQLVQKKFIMSYSCALDRYETEGADFASFELWSKYAYNTKSVMRKVENDWKQVYLCRKEGAKTGRIVWSVQLKHTSKRITTVSLKMSRTTFEDGKVDIKIIGDRQVTRYLRGDCLKTLDFIGSSFLLIEAHFSGGRGDTAWQHAQLFRQPEDSKEFPFELFLTFD